MGLDTAIETMLEAAEVGARRAIEILERPSDEGIVDAATLLLASAKALRTAAKTPHTLSWPRTKLGLKSKVAIEDSAESPREPKSSELASEAPRPHLHVVRPE
jgi:hypothetical protein